MNAPPCLVAIVLLAITVATCGNGDAEPYHAGGYPLDQLQADFDQYVALIHRDHPQTFTDRAAFVRTIAAQRDLLRDGMSERDLYRIVAPVGAAVRCGHTRTFLSEAGRDHFTAHGRCLPVEIRIINGRLYVYKDFTPDQAVPRGSRVLRIDGHRDNEIVARLRAGLHADGANVTYKDYAANRRFARLFTLFFGGRPQFELEIIASDGERRRTVTVAAMTPDRSDQVDGERYPPEPGPERLDLTFAEDNRYAVMTIKDFGYYEDLDAFLHPVGLFFELLQQRGSGALIIDLRGNDGGDPYCSAAIVSHVIDKPVRYFAADTPYYDDLVQPRPVPADVFTGELFVLVDGWCFSSTGHLLSLLRCHGRGVFVGEESGGSTACNDASRMHTLDHTGLRLNLPRATFATSADCLPLGRGIPADVGMRPTIEDLIAGRDVVLEKAIALVDSR